MDLVRRRRLSGRWRLMAIIGAIVAFAAIAIPELAQGASAAPAKDHCNSVEFLGARGSGQPWDVTGPDKGFGPEAYKVVTTVAAQLSAKKVSYGEDSSSYPADSVNDLKPSTLEILGLPATLPLYYQDNVSTYLASIATGVNFMVADVQNSAAVCGNATRLVLVGYSQGAMVVHQAEDYLYVHDRAALSHIIATVVIADGDRMPNTRAKEFGTSGASGEGLQVYLGHFSSHLDMPLPATTANVCNANDIVCNFGIPQVVHFSASARVHTTSYANCSGTRCTYGSALVSAANWAAGVVLKRV
jgi:hypothetical protein